MDDRQSSGVTLRFFRGSLLGLLVVAITGCGGGGGDPATSACGEAPVTTFSDEEPVQLDELTADTAAIVLASEAAATEDTAAVEAPAEEPPGATEAPADTEAPPADPCRPDPCAVLTGTKTATDAAETTSETVPGEAASAEDTVSEGTVAEEPTAETAAAVSEDDTVSGETAAQGEPTAETDPTTTGCGEGTGTSESTGEPVAEVTDPCATMGAETTDPTAAIETGSEDTLAVATVDEEPTAETAAAVPQRETTSQDAAAADPTAGEAAPTEESSQAAVATQTLDACGSAEPTCSTPVEEDAATETTGSSAATEDAAIADTVPEEPTAETAAAAPDSADTEAPAEGDAPAEGANATETTVPAAECLPYDDDDLAFADRIGAQVTRGNEIAGLALDPRAESSPAIQDLATQLQANEQGDLASVEGILAGWGESIVAVTPEVAELDQAALQLLGVATGVDFDRLWLRIAAGHVARTAAFAREAMDNAASGELIAVATAIATTATAQANTMIELLRS